MEQRPVSVTKSETSRRLFFKKLLFGSVGLYLMPLLKGCSTEGSYNASNDCKGLAPYKVWEEMLLALETSPDNLEARMKLLVKQGYPEAMFHFVRDEFYLIPPTENKIGYLNISKWGIRYALRSGFATPREKAELLHEMFVHAGIPSKIVSERTEVSEEEAKKIFLRPVDRLFAPEISGQKMERWAQEMGYESFPENNQNPFEGIVEEAEELGQKIWNTMTVPKDYRYFNDFNFTWDYFETPTVSFEWEGQTRYAHLFDPAVPFGKLRSDSPRNIKEAKPLKINPEKVSLRITYRDSIAPGDEKELISGGWPAVDLVGRQLDVQFLNNLTLEEQATTKVRNVRTFTPAISLQAIDESREYMAERSILADPITVSGQRIYLNEKNDTVKIGDSILLNEANPELQKKVTDIQVNAKSAGYPSVKVSICPTDQNGALVEGLSASSFVIKENGQPVRALMESNQHTPRILFMVDASGSMPDSYSGEHMQHFVEELKSKVLEKYPASNITYWETTSSLYTWLLKGSKTTNDLIIFATDGHVWDEFDPNNETAYANGPPAIVLDVINSEYERNLKTFKKMAAVTGGMHLPAKNQQAALQGIISYLEAVEIPPYVFTYNSAGPEGKREVTTTFDNDRLTATTTYNAIKPAEGEPPGPGIIGLYLTLQYDGKREEVRRVLAGWDDELNPKLEPSQSMVDAVNDFLFSKMRISFEGAGPTSATALCDLLKTRLSTRKWGEALLQNQLKTAKEEFKKGFLELSGETMTLMAPITEPMTKDSITIPAGLRIGIETFIPGLLSGESSIGFDYLPTSNYFTLGEDPETAFGITLKKTAELAIREKRLFDTSTFSLLADKNWINYTEARDSNWFDNLSRDNGEYTYWRKRMYGAGFKVFDASGSTRSFWNINRYTGELYGILPDATGGGGERFRNDIDGLGNVDDLLMSIIAIMEHVASMAGKAILSPMGGTSLGIIAKYGITLTKLYAIASEAILIMDTTGMDEKIKKALQGLACEVMKEIAFGITGDPGKMMGGLDNLIGMIMGDDYPFSCAK